MTIPTDNWTVDKIISLVKHLKADDESAVRTMSPNLMWGKEFKDAITRRKGKIVAWDELLKILYSQEKTDQVKKYI